MARSSFRRSTPFRTYLSIPAILVASLLVLLSPDPARAAPPEMVPGEVLVKFKQNATVADIRAVMEELGSTRLRRFGRIRAEHHRITRLSAQDAVNRFRNHRAIEAIEPNWILQADDVPNDPDFHLLWGLLNTGQTGGLPGADIDAVPAWDTQTGSSDVVVAIIDTGTDYNHPDLATNIWTNPGEVPGNQIDDDGNGWIDDVHGFDYYWFDGDPMDDNGHGTHVAGTIGATGDNALGITGVAWNVRIMPLKFLGPDGFGSTSSAIQCIEYATQMGAHIMNNSWGGGSYSSLLEDAIESANSAGIVFVAAAGNSGVSLDLFPHYPASYNVPNVIAVASTTAQDVLSSFSNYGATTVHVAAPGSSIYSTLPNNGYGLLSGTSMATPHVCGALALLLSEFPNMAPEQLKTVLLNSADPLPSLAGSVLSGGRLNAVRMLEGPDSLPPAPVTDLIVHDVESDRVVLRWTATGDDGSQGRASRYDLRYALAPITNLSFASAQPVSGVPIPRPSGTAEEATVTGLQFQTAYYFALKVVDEYGNASSLSNPAGAMTIGPPDIAVTPGSLEQSLLTGQQGDRVITITNTGDEGALEFSAASASPSTATTPQPFMVLGKGEPDPRVGDPVMNGKGGPDQFGYQWVDSDETGGPVFQWIDISGMGTLVPISGDDVTSNPIPIGFQFPFYDDLHSSVRVSSNGFLSFTSSSADYTNQLLPNPSAPENMVAAFWDDLYLVGGSTAHTWTDGHRFIVQWTNVEHYGSGGPYTFQVVLHSDGTILYQYLYIGEPSSSATVGIQNATRNDGLTVVFNHTYVRSGLAVRIQAAPTWLSMTPSSGRLEAGQSMPVTVRFDATSLQGGEYSGVVRIVSNDPDETVTDVPALLHIQGAPDIEFSTPSLSFAEVFVQGTGIRSVWVSNAGVLPLEVTDVRTSPSVFEVDDAPFTLNPGETREVEVRFLPVATGTFSGTLTVLSDDPDEGIATLGLTGTAILPPDVAVAPASLSAALFTGETTTRQLSIDNTGATPLSWRAFADAVSGSSLQTYQLEPPSPQGGAPDGASSAQDSGLARSGPLEATLASLTGVRVLFDLAHGNSDPFSWNGLIQTLAQRGATVVTITQPFTAGNLSNGDILWITDSSSPWQPSELSAVTAWLQAGGAILLEGDNFSTVGIYNTFLTAAGVTLRYTTASGTSGITNRVYPHVVTRDVDAVRLEANLATLTGIEAPAVLLLEDVAGAPSGAAASVGGGKLLAFTDEVFSDFHTGYADNQLLANQAFDWLSGITWLDVSPAQGTTPPGGNATVTVTLDAAGLAGGEHLAQVVVASNDPDEPEIAVPVSLQVTGAPDIALDRLASPFGPVFLTASRADTIRVTNTGTASLSVQSIEIGDPDFQAQPASFELGLGQSMPLIFTFAPTRLGPIEAAAVIHSNDPDESAITIALSGEGRAPPEIDVAPASFSEALNTGQMVTRTLRIENVSGSDLVFQIEVEDPDPAPPGGSTPPQPATTTTWAEFRARGAEAPDSMSLAPPILPVTLPLVVTDPVGDATQVDVAELRASSGGGQLQVEMRLATVLQAFDFGGFLSLDVDQNPSTGYRPSFGSPGQDIGMEYEIELFSIGSGFVHLYNRINGGYVGSFAVQLGSHSLQFALPLSALGNDDGKIDVTGVVGSSFGPTDWFPDTGHGTIGGPTWLSVEPSTGTMPAGSGMDITVLFDASTLDGGPYAARIVVESNDPDERRTEVPVSLVVTGVPLFAVQPGSLDFGSIFLGTRADRSFTVFNVGSAPLDVQGITVDDPSYVFDPSAFSLAPRTSRVVPAQFAPVIAGEHDAALSIAHNAEGSPGVVSLSGVGVPPPVLTATPQSFAFTVETGEEESQTLTLGNAGGSDLTYSIDAESAAAQVEPQPSMEIPRGAVDPRQGEPVTQGSGGPDAFGYRWTDSDEPGGPVFDWVEISQIGTRLPMRNLDENHGPVPIGFEFPFYGNSFSTFRICTHGWISFTSPEIRFTNQPLPSFGAPENLLAAFWDDLNFSGVERAYVHHDGTRLIIQWNDVPGTSGAGRYTFQILLYPNGTILYQYLTMTPPVTAATVGIQNASRNDGLQVVFNSSYIHDRLAIRFSPAPNWLEVEPVAGTIPPGATQPVRLTADAAGIFPGDYPATLRVRSNDPVTPAMSLPVSLHVIGIPELSVSPAELVFDTLYVGRSLTRELRITNTGTDRLDVSSAQPSVPDYAVSPGTMSLAPLQSAVMQVTLTASTAGDRGGWLTIASNDPDSPRLIPLTAVVLVPPRVSVEPSPLVAAALPGGTSTKTIQIRNTGGSDLRWNTGTPTTAFDHGVNHVEVAKGVEDMRPGIQGQGGPDQ
ncbi:MAG TPA: DUF4350 domain-containing protein, partial [Candidatus Eisenbacteria bacterium]|nr:DUF4350 domain-containing protein [Candidatus Eisenbacteria bacterium]